MTAYAIVELTVKDPAAMDRYRALAVPAVTHHGGRFVARSAEPQQLEGCRPHGEQVVLIEFASTEVARQWYESDEYAHALELRDEAMTRRLTLVAS